MTYITEKQLKAVAEVVGQEAVDAALFYGGSEIGVFVQIIFEETGVNVWNIIEKERA